jgi:hypothetical protein
MSNPPTKSHDRQEALAAFEECMGVLRDGGVELGIGAKHGFAEVVGPHRLRAVVAPYPDVPQTGRHRVLQITIQPSPSPPRPLVGP